MKSAGTLPSTGPVVSATVTVNVRWTAWLPAASSALHLTVVVASGNVERDAGKQLRSGDGSVLSAAVALYATVAPAGSVASATAFPGTAITGGVASNVCTASPLVTVKAGEPETDSDETACPVTVPSVSDVKTSAQRPDASVLGPASSQVLAAASMTAVAPFEPVSATLTCSPGAGAKAPVPTSRSSVTVKVCGAPTSVLPPGPTAILASTHCFTACGEF